MVEQLNRNQHVGGSSPLAGSIIKRLKGFGYIIQAPFVCMLCASIICYIILLTQLLGDVMMAGQVIKRGNRTYLVRVPLGSDANGKRLYHNKTIHGTKKEAEAYKNKILHQISTGTYANPSNVYFVDYISDWLESVAKPRVSSKTFRGYEQSVRLYLKPSLGNTKLDKITPDQIQKMYNKMLNRDLSSSTVKNAHAVLNSALKQAVKWNILNRNPAELVDLPRNTKEEEKALTPDQAIRFIEACTYNRMKPFFTLMIATGMRPGEALGLKWGDIDFDNNKITINRSLSRPGGKWVLVPPKTQKARRTISVPSAVMSDLREQKENQNEEKNNLKNKTYNDHGFVFATKTGEPFSDRNIISRYFKPLLKAEGLPDIKLYGLRHTCITLLLSAGENIKVVSERIGHADVSLTLRTYAHVLPNMQQEATSKLEKILFTSTDGDG